MLETPTLAPLAIDVGDMIKEMGYGGVLARFNLQEAYKAVPVHLVNQPKLAISWNGDTLVDRALPFGLQSAPKLFSALTDGFMWGLHKKGILNALHYLDDFLTLGQANSVVCQTTLSTALRMCDQAGLLVAPEKTKGPATTLSFLGIELDTQRMQLHLLQDTHARLQAAMARWTHPRAGHPSGTKRDLLALVGLLNHATKFVHPGA